MGSLSIGKAWDEARAALQSGRRLLVPVALGLLLLPAVIVAMVQPPVAAGEQAEAGSWMLIALLMLIVMILGQIAIVLLVNGWRGSVGEAIARAARRTPTMIAAALIIMVPVVLILAVLLSVAAVGTSGSGDFNLASLNLAGTLVLLLCLLLLIYLSVRLLPMIAAVAAESIGPVAAIKRSFALTRGNFWRLFAFVLVIMIAFLVIAMVSGAVLGSLITVLLGRPEPWSVSHLLIALVGGVVQTAFILVYTAMLARIYAQLATPAATVPEVRRED